MKLVNFLPSKRGRFFKVGAITLQIETQDFLDATGITDVDTIAALDGILVPGIKNLGWSRFKAVYPMMGGLASTVKFNLINPLDTNAAHRLSSATPPTASANGIQGNGISQYYSTHLNPSLAIPSATSYSQSVYSNSVVISREQLEIGAVTQGNSTLISTRYIDNNTYFDNVCTTNNRVIVNNAGQTGLILGSRVANNDSRGFVRGLQVGTTQTIIAGGLTSHDLYLLAYNDSGTPDGFSNRALQFAHVGEGMTAAEVAIFNTFVHNTQVALARGAY